jgi:hypothetical protein
MIRNPRKNNSCVGELYTKHAANPIRTPELFSSEAVTGLQIGAIAERDFFDKKGGPGASLEMVAGPGFEPGTSRL